MDKLWWRHLKRFPGISILPSSRLTWVCPCVTTGSFRITDPLWGHSSKLAKMIFSCCLKVYLLMMRYTSIWTVTQFVSDCFWFSKSLLWCAEMKITENVYYSRKEDSPHAGSDCVFLSPPCGCVVDGLAVDLQPLTHLPQTLLEDGSDPSVGRWTDVHQQVSTTWHSLHQRLTPKHNTH